MAVESVSWVTPLRGQPNLRLYGSAVDAHTLTASVVHEGVAQLVVEDEVVGAGGLAAGLGQRDVALRGELAGPAVVGDLVGEEDLAVVADLDVAARHHPVVPGVVDQLLHGDFEHAPLRPGRDLRKVRSE